MTFENKTKGLITILSIAFCLSSLGSLSAEDYDLYILAGQSNMDGRGDAEDLPEDLRRESKKAIIFYRNPIGASDGWKKLRPGYSFAPKKLRELPTNTFGPEIGFTQAMLKANPEQPLALIKASRGGTSLRRDWAPGQAGQPDSQKLLYRMLIETVGLATKALEAEGHTYTLKGFLWHQGESDRKMSAEDYQEHLEEFIARVREDLKSPELPVVVGEVFDNGQRDNTRAAIQATAAASDTIGLVTAEGTTTWDETTHFDAKSQLLLGERYAGELRRLLNGPILNAEEIAPLTSIRGKVVFPETIPEGINTEGLSLKDAVVTLEGKYSHPRMPYPPKFREMTLEERRAWNSEFINSEDYPIYQRKVEVARAKRFTATAEVAEDGSFTLDKIKPAWYQLTVKIMPSNVPEKAGYELARAYALRQFFVKDTGEMHPLGKLTLELKNVLMPGDEAPDFTFEDYRGGTFELSDFQGKYVLFDFWATWCGPCIAQIPNLEAVSEEFGGERFETLGLSIDEKSEDAKSFLKKKPSQYRQGYVGSEKLYSPIRMAYGIHGIPSIWLIDPEGKIVARDLMGRSIQETVTRVFDTPEKTPDQ